MITARTGLLLDPYFSGTKIKWLLDHVPAPAPARARRAGLRHVDTFLIWKLTGGKVHATDATNAARTLLYNIAGANGTPTSAPSSTSRCRCCPR
jgi:glycerol kinase